MQSPSKLIVRRILQQGESFFVSEAPRAFDQGAGKTRALRCAISGETDEDGMRQPNDMWVQAADAVAQTLGQHRDDAIGKVNAVPALERLTIERTARG